MLPVSAWPPGPPGAELSPFGRPRNINLAFHRFGYVLPKGAWVVQTGSNRVLMFRPAVQHYNPPRVPGTGILPGQGPGYGPRPPQNCPPVRPPTRVYRVEAQISRGGGQPNKSVGAAAVANSVLQSAVAPAVAANPNFPKKVFDEPAVSRETGGKWEGGWRPPVPQRFLTHDEYLERWRAWQRRVGRTDPPIRPLPGRVPPNFFGWRRDPCAPATVLVHPCSGGTVLADGQNVVIAGVGFANITQAFSV